MGPYSSIFSGLLPVISCAFLDGHSMVSATLSADKKKVPQLSKNHLAMVGKDRQ